MSVRRVSETIQLLTNKEVITKSDIESLREAAGPKVSEAERGLVDSFSLKHPEALTLDAAHELQASFDVDAQAILPLTLLETPSLKVPESSGIVALGDGRFLVADDAKGILYRKADGDVKMLAAAKDFKALKGLEGLCLSEDGSTLYAVSENTRKVVSIPMDDQGGTPSLGKPEVLGKLPVLGRAPNKGWEGIAVLPAAHSPIDEDCIVTVHEGFPRCIGIFTLPDLEEVDIIRPPESALGHLNDISDIAVHPETGHLFVLSDESQSIVELSLTTKLSAGPGGLLETNGLEALRTFKLPLNKKQKPEGITFLDSSTMFVACDGSDTMLKFQLNDDH